jgi:pyrroloquinoline quinone (PQQ) biosynthesis protein C
MESLRGSRFLSRCLAGSVSPRELQRFVSQHYHYSRNFTRYLCALISNLSEERDRRALIDNLFEEMGKSATESHVELYRRMMSVLLPPGEPPPPLPATQALIETMLECARSPRPMVGLGALCLGAEAIVPEVYAAIVNGFRAVGEPHEHLHFFTLHIECDDDHARTMRDIILRELEREPRARLDLEYGAACAIGARVAFFDALAEEVS